MKRLQQTPQWGQLYFLWAGSGCEADKLKAQADELGVARYIRFLGERSDIDRLLDAADIFVLPSHFEGMPLSIIEAMAKGCAVAATNISGIPEALGNTGKLLSDPDISSAQTVRELSDILEQWVTACDQRKAVAEACHVRAQSLFQPAVMINAYVELIESILMQV